MRWNLNSKCVGYAILNRQCGGGVGMNQHAISAGICSQKESILEQIDCNAVRDAHLGICDRLFRCVRIPNRRACGKDSDIIDRLVC